MTAGDMLLSVEDSVVRFRTHEGTIHAVNGVSFQLEEGERLGLVGESGCGKSVTNLAMIRLLPQPAGRIEGGHVMFDAQDLTTLREDELRSIRGRDIAMIFQDPMTSLNPVLTVEEQMVETIMAHREISRDKAKARAIELLKMVGIPQPETRLNNFPHQFSGGMRQRVMIAMALALEPKLMIADEPTTALDVTIQAQVLELLRGLTEQAGSAMILITHDLGVVAGMTNRINVMYAATSSRRRRRSTCSRPRRTRTRSGCCTRSRALTRGGEPLIPIEGRPPDMRRAPTFCPFAGRCRWRLDICWQENPPLRPTIEGTRVVMTGTGRPTRSPASTRPTEEEAACRQAAEPGFRVGPAAGRHDRRGRGGTDRLDSRPGRLGRRYPGRGGAALARALGRRSADPTRARAPRRTRDLP
jgi:ABC-type dipeptide/oligopeptide/nickel transport system ATPase component